MTKQVFLLVIAAFSLASLSLQAPVPLRVSYNGYSTDNITIALNKQIPNASLYAIKADSQNTLNSSLEFSTNHTSINLTAPDATLLTVISAENGDMILFKDNSSHLFSVRFVASRIDINSAEITNLTEASKGVAKNIKGSTVFGDRSLVLCDDGVANTLALTFFGNSKVFYHGSYSLEQRIKQGALNHFLDDTDNYIYHQVLALLEDNQTISISVVDERNYSSNQFTDFTTSYSVNAATLNLTSIDAIYTSDLHPHSVFVVSEGIVSIFNSSAGEKGWNLVASASFEAEENPTVLIAQEALIVVLHSKNTIEVWNIPHETPIALKKAYTIHSESIDSDISSTSLIYLAHDHSVLVVGDHNYLTSIRISDGTVLIQENFEVSSSPSVVVTSDTSKPFIITSSYSEIDSLNTTISIRNRISSTSISFLPMPDFYENSNLCTAKETKRDGECKFEQKWELYTWTDVETVAQTLSIVFDIIQTEKLIPSTTMELTFEKFNTSVSFNPSVYTKGTSVFTATVASENQTISFTPPVSLLVQTTHETLKDKSLTDVSYDSIGDVLYLLSNESTLLFNVSKNWTANQDLSLIQSVATNNSCSNIAYLPLKDSLKSHFALICRSQDMKKASVAVYQDGNPSSELTFSSPLLIDIVDVLVDNRSYVYQVGQFMAMSDSFIKIYDLASSNPTQAIIDRKYSHINESGLLSNFSTVTAVSLLTENVTNTTTIAAITDDGIIILCVHLKEQDLNCWAKNLKSLYNQTDVAFEKVVWDNIKLNSDGSQVVVSSKNFYSYLVDVKKNEPAKIVHAYAYYGDHVKDNTFYFLNKAMVQTGRHLNESKCYFMQYTAEKVDGFELTKAPYKFLETTQAEDFDCSDERFQMNDYIIALEEGNLKVFNVANLYECPYPQKDLQLNTTFTNGHSAQKVSAGLKIGRKGDPTSYKWLIFGGVALLLIVALVGFILYKKKADARASIQQPILEEKL